MDALREYKAEIVEAHRHGLNVHRIAEIFRERGVDISKIHLMRAIRRFIEEEERARSGASAGQGISTGKEAKAGVSYQVVEQPSAVVRGEEFAKQLRIARFLAGTGLPAARVLEPALPAKTRQEGKPVKKGSPKTKKETPRQKPGDVELAKERRRAGRAVRQKTPASESRATGRDRHSPGH
jgi:hypothetical protein